MALLLKVWKGLLKIPVIFAHFPLPSLLIVGIAMAIASTLATCTVKKLEAGARAELKAMVAEIRAEHAEKVADAATARADTIVSVTAEKDAIFRENQRAWFGALTSLTTAVGDKSALIRLRKEIQELHNDPKYACRLEPLPAPYLDSMQINREAPRLAESP